MWIDFACYNQHTFEAIATDMMRVVEMIGSLSVCATPTPVYTRCWCLWELLCAHETGAEVSLLIRERFSSSWHELQDRNEQMKFSPSPWIYGDAGVAPGAFRPHFEAGLLDATVLGSQRTVRELFAESGVYLAREDMARVTQFRAKGAWETTDDVTRDFFRCLLSGDGDGVRKHLDRGCDPNALLDTLLPITIAAGRGDATIAEMLIDAGAAIEPTSTDDSPLRLAADRGHCEVVRLLLRRGATVDAAHPEDGWTALLWAASSGHADIASCLLTHGADPRIVAGPKKITPLHMAAANGHTDVVALLLDAGVEASPRAFDGSTPLSRALMNGRGAVAAMLRAAADLQSPASKREMSKAPSDMSREELLAGLDRLQEKLHHHMDAKYGMGKKFQKERATTPRMSCWYAHDGYVNEGDPGPPAKRIKCLRCGATSLLDSTQWHSRTFPIPTRCEECGFEGESDSGD